MSDQWGLPVLVFLCFLWWPISENTKQYFWNTSSQYLWNNTKLSKQHKLLKHNTNLSNYSTKLLKHKKVSKNSTKLGKHNTKLSKHKTVIETQEQLMENWCATMQCISFLLNHWYLMHLTNSCHFFVTIFSREMFCAYCGGLLKHSSKFCHVCGEKVENDIVVWNEMDRGTTKCLSFKSYAVDKSKGRSTRFWLSGSEKRGAEEERRYFILIIVGIMIVIVRIVTLLRVVNVGSGCPISWARGSWQKCPTIYNTIYKHDHYLELLYLLR